MGATFSDFQPGKATPTSGCLSTHSGPALLESPHWIPTASTSRILPSALSPGAGTWQVKFAVFLLVMHQLVVLHKSVCLQGLSTCSMNLLFVPLCLYVVLDKKATWADCLSWCLGRNLALNTPRGSRQSPSKALLAADDDTNKSFDMEVDWIRVSHPPSCLKLLTFSSPTNFSVICCNSV